MKRLKSKHGAIRSTAAFLFQEMGFILSTVRINSFLLMATAINGVLVVNRIGSRAWTG